MVGLLARARNTKNSLRAAGLLSEPQPVAKDVRVNWLFYHRDENPTSSTEMTVITGDHLKDPLESLVDTIADVLLEQYKFEADPDTIIFYTPREQVSRSSIKHKWISSHELETVAKEQEENMRLDAALGNSQEWNDELLHLIVTAEKKRQVNWLFYHRDENPRSSPEMTVITGDRLKDPLKSLVDTIADVLLEQYKFEADPDTIIFYTPQPQMSIAIDEDWISSHELETVAEEQEANMRLDAALGNPQEWNDELLHLIVTAEKKRQVNWLFYHRDENPRSSTRMTVIAGDRLKDPLKSLVDTIADVLLEKYNFEADRSTIVFYTPREQVSRSSIKHKWISSHELETVAEEQEENMRLDAALGNPQEWNDELLHLIVTAEKKRQVNWLFYDRDKNPSSATTITMFANNCVNATLDSLAKTFADGLLRKYRFKADIATIAFHMPQKQISTAVIDENWIFTHELRTVAMRQQADVCLADVLGNLEERSNRLLHLIVTAVAETEAEASARNGMNAFGARKGRFDRILEMTHTMESPSVSARSQTYYAQQSSTTTAMHDGFFSAAESAPSTIAPPIQIFHPVFQSFLQKIADPALEPDSAVIKIASEMMTTAAEIPTSEDNRNVEMRKQMRQLLNRPVEQIMRIKNTSADGMVKIQVQDTPVTLVVIENQRMLGEGGCDALTQAEYSALHILKEKDSRKIPDSSCCPMFIIGGGGPYVAIMGAVMTENFIVQRLTDLMWLGEASVYEDAHVYRVAQVFTALRQAVDELDQFYNEVLAHPPTEVPPIISPYPVEYTAATGTVVKFSYERRMEPEPECVTFLATTKEEPPSQVVIKFVDRYGANAHQLMALHQFAPSLRYFGTLDGRTATPNDDGPALRHGLYVGPLRMVVMDYVQGHTTSAIKDWRLWTPKLSEQIKDALKLLHDAGYVFGDLRRPNVMVSEDGERVQLIDFNWAGKAGEARYPRRLSSLEWARGVEDLALITKEHDEEMLEIYFAG